MLVYNTFPVPELSDDDKAALRDCARSACSGAREQFPDQTLAELYDPEKMPEALREAHTRLDETVDRLYRDRGFASDEERLELLFEMYEEQDRGCRGDASAMPDLINVTYAQTGREHRNRRARDARDADEGVRRSAAASTC